MAGGTTNIGYALLSNEKDYTIFKFGNRVIKFKSAYSLEYYSSVKEWNHGYLVVMAKYLHNKENEEEYIDLIPILEDLYIDADDFLNQIKEVRLQDAVYDNRCRINLNGPFDDAEAAVASMLED